MSDFETRLAEALASGAEQAPEDAILAVLERVESSPKRRAPVTWPGGRTATPMRIALYEPDIPQNAGTILRLAACLGAQAHIIEPAGFPVTDRAFRRAGMDYLDQDSLLRLILMSFIARSREGAICRELRVVVWAADLERINMPEVAAFLRTLATGVDRV